MMDRRTKHILSSQNHMATTFDLCISLANQNDFGKTEKSALNTLHQCHKLISEIENQITEFKPCSPVFRLNHAAMGEKIYFTEHAFDLLKHSLMLRELTRFAFDCFAKSKTHYFEKIPVELDEDQKLVWKTHPEAHLSFGAIGKGYALDQVRTVLERETYQNYFLSAGGSSILLSGWSAPHTPWKWAWSWEKKEDQYYGQNFEHRTGSTVSIGVSGSLEKGQHIVSKKSFSVTEKNLSTLVAFRGSAADADALSTALYVSGWEHSKHWTDKVFLTPALATISASKVPSWNGYFESLFKKISYSSACFSVMTISFLNSLLLASVWLLKSSLALAQDETINLDDLDAASNTGQAATGTQFTPYLFDRQPLWILLPIFGLALVLLHLKNNRYRKKGKTP